MSSSVYDPTAGLATTVPAQTNQPDVSGPDTGAEDDGALDLVVDEDQVQSTPAPADPQTDQPQSSTPNAHLRDSVELTSPKRNSYQYSVRLPSRTLGVFTSLLSEAVASNESGIENQSSAEWKDAINGMMGYYTPTALYENRFTEADSEFYQGVVREDGSLLQASSPKFRNTTGEIKGEMALLKISRALGQGEVLTVPLPHSGINVTIKPPGETAIINFYNSVFREKIALGRMTAGLTLTNFSVYINNRLFDFIVDHIHAVNYVEMPKDQLKKFILLPDFYFLAHGFAAAMYPEGFEYQRPCISPDGKCDYVAEGMLNLLKVTWIDNQALTLYQKQTLCEQRPGKLTLDAYHKYQLDHKRTVASSFTLDNGMKFYTRTPTFDDYVTDGMGWINEINAAVDSLITLEGDEDKARSELMQQRIKSSMLRQFSHYVDYIEYDGNVINHRPTLNSALELLSADDVYRDEVYRNIMEYKSKTTIGVIGIPEYKCPNCHLSQNTEVVNQGLVSVIPLDVMNLFFTLLTLRMSRILER